MDDQRVSLVEQVFTDALDAQRELLDCLRDAIALAMVDQVPADATIARWQESLKKAEGRQ
jgi:hypothetical protein